MSNSKNEEILQISENELKTRSYIIQKKLKLKGKKVQLCNMNATCKLNSEGNIILEIFIENFVNKNDLIYSLQFDDKNQYLTAHVNFHGKYDKTLSPFDRFRIERKLPLYVRFQVTEFEANALGTGIKFRAQTVLEQRRLSHEDPINFFEKMIQAGDDFVGIEIHTGERKNVIGIIVTKPSIIKKSLIFDENIEYDSVNVKRPTIRYDGDLSNLKSTFNLLKQLRYFLFPITFIIASWLLVFSSYSQKIMDKCFEFRNPFVSSQNKSQKEILYLGNVDLVDSFS